MRFEGTVLSYWKSVDELMGLNTPYTRPRAKFTDMQGGWFTASSKGTPQRTLLSLAHPNFGTDTAGPYPLHVKSDSLYIPNLHLNTISSHIMTSYRMHYPYLEQYEYHQTLDRGYGISRGSRSWREDSDASEGTNIGE